MRSLKIVALSLIAFGSGQLLTVGQAEAQTCSGTALTGAQVASVVGGMYVCGPSPVQASTLDWDEYHSGSSTALSGNITDYKKGPADPNDPSKMVGTYSIKGNGTITYAYTAGGSFAFTVYSGPSPYYSFCSTTSGTNVLATVQSTPCYSP